MEDTFLQEFVERLRSAHGSNLVSVILYGERATRIRNLLVVLGRIMPEDLRAEHDAVAEWVREGYPPPVYFTESEIAGASDVFPIEFFDMMTNRRVVTGRDVLEGLDVSTRNLRHQVEYELRGKLIRLRRHYVGASSDPGQLSGLLVASIRTFSRLFKFALRLAGEETIPERGPAVIRATVARFGIDPAPFDAIYAARDSGKPMPEVDAHECFGSYIGQIEKVIEAVDGLPESESRIHE